MERSILIILNLMRISKYPTIIVPCQNIAHFEAELAVKRSDPCRRR
jgi:hypothetical protein